MIKYYSLNIPQTDRYSNRIMKNSNMYKLVIDKIKQKAVNDICENKYYNPIEELVQSAEPKFFAKTLKVRIVQDEEDLSKHFMEAVVSSNHSPVEITRPIMYGDKDTMLRFLSESGTANKLSEHFNEMLSDIKNVY